MFTDFIPPVDQDLNAWALNFSTLITATPTAYGLTSGQATAYATLQGSFDSALATATDPSTRTKPAVAAKDAARVALVTSSRSLASIVQGFPTITAEQLSDLGLTVRSSARTPVPAPATKPMVQVIGNSGLVQTLSFKEEGSAAPRAKPFGALGIQVYAKIGDVAPVSVSECTLIGVATRTPTNFAFAPAAVGEKVHYLCRYFTRRQLTGPTSDLVTSTIAA